MTLMLIDDTYVNSLCFHYVNSLCIFMFNYVLLMIIMLILHEH